jgi:hypothetical protein
MFVVVMVPEENSGRHRAPEHRRNEARPLCAARILKNDVSVVQEP